MVVEKLAKGDRLTLVVNTEPEGKIRVQCYQWAEEPKVMPMAVAGTIGFRES